MSLLPSLSVRPPLSVRLAAVASSSAHAAGRCLLRSLESLGKDGASACWPFAPYFPIDPFSGADGILDESLDQA